MSIKIMEDRKKKIKADRMSLRQHLKKRGMPAGVAIEYEEENVATFFLYNLSGKIIGYQRYRPDGLKKNINDPRISKYYTQLAKGAAGVWPCKVFAQSQRNI